MVKSGLIVGAVMFFIVLLLAVGISPLCALCVPLFTGLGAGYLTGIFDKPLSNSQAAQRGAIAGAIAGGISLPAQMIASVINAMVLQNPQFQLSQFFGGEVVDPTTVWLAQIAFAICIGLLNIGLTTAFGAGGGAIWFSTKGEKQVPVI
ncbi:MAG: hypothetical protein N2117_01510 [Anaerolineales bacterium]|nr:hypothetical protein [Anaerolineales bacterium]MCX7753910.1 hypothetical protein [Anaerolineales bacterium]MDW8276864.1 hypothetical protein [Anaerolineales bacterium]